MNDLERDEITRCLQALVRRYCLTESGKWISDFEWAKIPVELKDLGGDVVGKYSFGKIILKESYEPNLIFSVYVHELRHRWQWITNPVKYIIGKVIRPIIERDAYHQQDLAEKWICDSAPTSHLLASWADETRAN